MRVIYNNYWDKPWYYLIVEMTTKFQHPSKGYFNKYELYQHATKSLAKFTNVGGLENTCFICVLPRNGRGTYRHRVTLVFIRGGEIEVGFMKIYKTQLIDIYPIVRRMFSEIISNPLLGPNHEKTT